MNEPKTDAGKWLMKLLRAVPRGTTMTDEQRVTADLVEKTLPLIEEQAAQHPEWYGGTSVGTSDSE